MPKGIAAGIGDVAVLAERGIVGIKSSLVELPNDDLQALGCLVLADDGMEWGESTSFMSSAYHPNRCSIF